MVIMNENLIPRITRHLLPVFLACGIGLNTSFTFTFHHEQIPLAFYYYLWKEAWAT
jgi:hypothetical protein